MNYKKENGWNCIDSREVVFDFSEGYKKFLDGAKTEREFVTEGIKLVEKNGFVNAEKKDKLTVGDKVYYVNRGKNLVLAVIGKEDIENGINYVVSHVDSPRLDLKGNPLYEDLDLAYMKTHYYGGIKKYQWASLPLALHGVVVLASGEKVEITIGEKDEDPVFTIPDILPHLSAKIQGDRKTGEVIKGEELQIIVGSIPSSIEDKDVKEKIKYTVLEILNRDYGMIEEDFISAELELVPAGRCRDLGFDRSMIGGYGQDDRICGYTSMMAIIDLKEIPERTAVCFLADKEEIGSTGSTGLKSDYINYVTGDMIYKLKGNFNEMMLRKTLWNSNAMSSDVNAGIDPIFRSVHDAQNAAKIGYGVVVTKYTGARGKSGTNDADAEYVGKIRKMLNDAKVNWQIGELGKVDEGGGGTVAMYLAHLGINTIDIGPALLAMHSPFEVSSKLDVYETYRAYKVFFRN
ncbi:aminopeptidase [Fusobacterium ulcerans]|uniref:aminopeptidase n=1 Tax=Fusobacterium ulcerans TaxID=861 RepID=UPI000E493B6D|nr:aminopeptidase [Fusobacterium ulcerans]RGY64389.1 aminopeptidase [Fusobacterium ulcerans]HJH07081.1 aminopeptidase [Fusobacterium ulcerans]